MRLPWRVQFGLVALGYLLALGISAGLIGMRYLQYVTHPADAAAYSGMWAGGDMLLGLFIGGMLLVVTFFLVLVIYKSEAAYTIFSKVLLALSMTAPASVALIAVPAVSQGNSLLGWACLSRVLASPMVLLGLGMSRLFARFPRAKRLTKYAFLIEAFTLVFLAAMLVLPLHLHGE